ALLVLIGVAIYDLRRAGFRWRSPLRIPLARPNEAPDPHSELGPLATDTLLGQEDEPKPLLAREVVYKDRPPPGRDFASEIRSGRPLWVAIFAGTHLRNQMMLRVGNPIERLLLVHPRGRFVEQLASMTPGNDL